MKFRRPTQNPGNEQHSRGSLVGVPNKRLPRPEWLNEWIANKAKHVLLVCGHKVDLKWNSQITLEGLEGEEKGVILTNCDPCGQFVAIERGLSYNEYHGLPTAIIPAEPLF